MSPYRGRFAPSPSGPLHLGSLVAALASWLDARAANGAWLVRIEDLDPPRTVPGADAAILRTLEACGLAPDEPVVYQSERGELYRAAFASLQSRGLVYGCACSRRDIELAVAAQAGSGTAIYPGTCADGGVVAERVRAWRVRVPDRRVEFVDRARGPFSQRLAHEVGDFIVCRADGCWAYQLAVVIDDAAQGITDIVRGGDLLDNTPRQIYLQQVLQLPTPRYLHVPLVVDAHGHKLSKQTGAAAVDAAHACDALERAALHLGLPPIGAHSVHGFLRAATDAWRERWPVG